MSEFRMGKRASGGANRRFKGAKVDPSISHGLKADHPAVVEGRTLFPTTVVASRDSPRLFVSGKNNPKLGARVSKGAQRGWPVYHLTLEERATCPRSCSVWNECYGNGMHMARRHRADAHLISEIGVEITMLASRHPNGFLVRLHTLGDFYSVAYVDAWAMLLDLYPNLHVFGFTARNEFDPDEESRAIAAALASIIERQWDRFAIRFSRPFPSPQGSMVVEKDPQHSAVVVCPAQTERTESCSTCGLCWAPAFRDKTVAFLRHGMKGGRRVAPVEQESESMNVKVGNPRQIHFVHTKKTREEETRTTIFHRPVNPAPSAAARRLAEHDAVVARAIGAPIPEQFEINHQRIR